jgi:hypothetical protein
MLITTLEEQRRAGRAARAAGGYDKLIELAAKRETEQQKLKIVRQQKRKIVRLPKKTR